MFDFHLAVLFFFETGITFPEHDCVGCHVRQKPYIYAPFSNFKRAQSNMERSCPAGGGDVAAPAPDDIVGLKVPKIRQTRKCCCGQDWCPKDAHAAFNVPQEAVTRLNWAYALGVTGLIFGKEYRVCAHHFRYEDLEIPSAKAREGGAPSVRLRRGAIPSVDETEYRSTLETSVEDCFRWRALAEHLASKDDIKSESPTPEDNKSASVLSVEARLRIDTDRVSRFSVPQGN